jgi:drug/metabolite transporter (DMT)-like permease
MSVMAVLSNVIPFALIAWGEEHIPSGTASILNATVPIFTAAIAAGVLTEERFTSARLGGLVLGFLGVAVLTGEDALHVTDSDVLGELAVVGAAACYGVGAVFARILLRGQDPVNLSILQLALGSLYTVPVLLIVSGTPDYGLDPEAWASLATLGLLGTGIGYIAWLWMIDNIGSVRASLVTYIVPVVAVVLGWLVLDESIGVNTIAGGLLIVAGVASVMRGQAPVRLVRREPVGATAAAE